MRGKSEEEEQNDQDPKKRSAVLEPLKATYLKLSAEYKARQQINTDAFEKQIHERFKRGYDYFSLQRLVEYNALHGAKKLPRTATLKAKFDEINAQLWNWLNEDVQPESQAVSGEFRAFTLYYFDWITQPKGHIDKGDTVTGTLVIPAAWQGKGAHVTLHDGSKMTGEAWVRRYDKKHLDVSVRLSADNRPDLCLLFHVADPLKPTELVGSFATANTVSHTPMHGTVYLRAVGKPNKAKQGVPPIDPAIRLSLHQQTVRHRTKGFGTSVVAATYEGYFINTYERRLEGFRLRVGPDGFAQIEYAEATAKEGIYSILTDNVSIHCFQFKYDDKAKVYLQRMQFRKKDSWYIGINTGITHEQLFMNRVAMQATTKKWEDIALISIPFTEDGKANLRRFFEDKPALRTYLSGEKDNQFPDNELLSETPSLLEQAGLLALTKQEEPDFGKDWRQVPAGDYCLYSLSRRADLDTNDDKDEDYSIVKLPLHIEDDGRCQLKGEGRTYYGTAKATGDKLLLTFTKRRPDKKDYMESGFLVFHIAVEYIKNGNKIKKYSLGTSNRFIETLPETRAELLVREEPDSFDKDGYESVSFFGPNWATFLTNKKSIALHMSGRVNRLIVPHKLKNDVPEGRQPPFRFLFAHAALSLYPIDGVVGTNTKKTEAFAWYYYHAVMHSFGQEPLLPIPGDTEQEQTLNREVYDEATLAPLLTAYFKKVCEAHAATWKDSFRKHAERLYVYLFQAGNEKNSESNTEKRSEYNRRRSM